MSRPPVATVAGRFVHPLAWWLWAAGLVYAAVRTTNPLLLGLLALAVCYVVAARRAITGTSRTYRLYCWAAIATVAVCMIVQVSVADGGRSSGGLLAAFCFGARIAVVILCVGAANALVSPLRLFGSSRLLMVLVRLPAAIGQVRRARRMRGIRFGRRPLLLPAALAEARARTRIVDASLQARGHARLSHRWGLAEWAVLAAGTATAVCFALASAAGLTPDPWALEAPTVPALAALGVLCAVLPAHLTPAPPAARAARSLRTKAAG